MRPFLISISKAKAARLVRSLLDLFLDMEAATGQEVELCLECIEWAKAEKRTFLRQALEVRCPRSLCLYPVCLRVPFSLFFSLNTSDVTLTVTHLLSPVIRLAWSHSIMTPKDSRKPWHLVSDGSCYFY